MPKISTHLWFDKEAKQAAEFYVSVFKGSRVKKSWQLHDTPSGSVDVVTIELPGQELTLLSAGPMFKINPSVSFLVGCAEKKEVDELWEKLSPGGMAMMELGAYPFSERYGWLQDKFGVSWQVMALGSREIKQKIVPMLMFVGEVCGRTEEALRLYASIFPDSKIGDITRYGKDEAPDKEGTVKHAAFTLAGRQFSAIESAHDHRFSFNEAVSFMVHCQTQEEIDHYWKKLSAAPQAEQCGWLKDKFGLSWQIVPAGMDEMLQGDDRARIKRVTEAFMKMKKLDLAALRRAYKS